MGSSPTTSFLDHLLTGELSDFTIQCNEVEFKVHKIVIIVHSGSPYFQTCITGPFAESTDNKLVIKETEPEALAIIIATIYIKDLPTKSFMVSKWPKLFSKPKFPWTECLIEAYALADRFLMDRTKEFLMTEILKDTTALLLGSDEKFFNTLLLIYETAKEDMSPLRAKVTAMCVAKRDREFLKADSRGRKLVEEHDGQAWLVGLEVAQACVREGKIPEKERKASVPPRSVKSPSPSLVEFVRTL